jgi:hypothetical protein
MYRICTSTVLSDVEFDTAAMIRPMARNASALIVRKRISEIGRSGIGIP